MRQWLPKKIVKARTKEDFEAQQKWGLVAVHWKTPQKDFMKGENAFVPPPPEYDPTTNTYVAPKPLEYADIAPNTPAGRAQAAERARLAAEGKLEAPPEPTEEPKAPEASVDDGSEGRSSDELRKGRPDPRARLDKKAYWKAYKVKGKRASQCAACGQEHLTMDAQWDCFDNGCPQKK